MSPFRRVWLTALAGLVPLAFAAPAAAAPFALGKGSAPRAVADTEGTVHAAWVEDRGSAKFAHYCRIPARATACDLQREWDFGSGSLEVAVVRNPANRAVIVTAESYASSTVPSGTYTLTSPLGDGTFERRRVAEGHEFASQGVAFGPGQYQLSFLRAYGGLDLLMASTNEGQPDFVQLEDILPTQFNAALGLVRHETPMVIGRELSVGGKLYWRAWSGAGDVRDLATWTPVGELPGVAGEPSLASNGVTAPVLVGRDGPIGARALTARRYDSALNGFTAPVTIAADDTAMRPKASSDSGSNLHLTYVTSRATPGKLRLVYLSPTGETWPTSPLVLADGEAPTDAVTATGSDGAGVVLWTRPGGAPGRRDDTIGAARVPGPAGFPPPGGPTCDKTPVLGIARLVAETCFRPGAGGTLETGDPFLVNGVKVDPRDGTARISPGSRRLRMPPNTRVSVGPIVLAKGADEWVFPAQGSMTLPTFANLGSLPGLGGNILQLKIAGDAQLTFTDGRSSLRSHLQLPEPFSSVNGDVTFKADNLSGLLLDELKVTAAQLDYGFRKLEISYTREPPTLTGDVEWQATGDPGQPGDIFAGKVVISKGKLTDLRVSGVFPAPGREVWPPLVYMHYAGLALKPKQLELQGQTVVSAGPRTVGPLFVSVGKLNPDGTKAEAYGSTTYRLKHPIGVRTVGPLYLYGFKIGSGYTDYRFPSEFSFGAEMQAGTDCETESSGKPELGVTAAIEGKVAVQKNPYFTGTATAKVCLWPSPTQDIAATLSSKAIMLCASLGGASVGVGHEWADSALDYDTYSEGCNMGKEGADAARAAQNARGGRSFRVASGLKQLNVRVTGTGGAPVATLTAPDGAVLRSTAGEGAFQGPEHLAYTENGERAVTFFIPRPKAGLWKVEPTAESTPIADVRLARDLPPVRVTGRVTRVARRRVLRYRVKPIPGQQVTFFEEGAKTIARLGAARGSRGKVAFQPRPGPGGVRRITALVESGGLPRRKLTLATYRVPAPPLPGQARRLRLVRRGSGVRLTWTPGAHTARQEVRVRLSDGTRKLFTLGPRTSKLTMRVSGTDLSGVASVIGARRDGRSGRSARTHLTDPRHKGSSR